MKTITTALSDVRVLPSLSGKTRQVRLNMRGARKIAWAAFILLNLLYLFAALQRNAIPGTIFDDLQADINIDGAQVMRLGAVYLYVYAGAQIAAGMLTDRFGGKRMGILSGMLMAVGLILFSVAKTPSTLYVSRIITAVGQSFIYLCVVKIAHLLFPARQFGFLISLSMAIGFAGSVLGTMPLQIVSQSFGWQAVFFTLGTACAISSIAIVFSLRPFKEKRKKSSCVTWRSFVNLFNEPGRFCFVTYNLFLYPSFFVFQAVLGQKLLQDYLELSATAASKFTMAMSIGCILFSLLSPIAIKYCGSRRKPFIVFAGLLQVFAILTMLYGVKFGISRWLFLTSFASLATMHIANSATSALMSEITDTKTIAFSAAIRNVFPYAGSGILAEIAGSIMGKMPSNTNSHGVTCYAPDTYAVILMLILSFTIVGTLFTLRIPETRGVHIYKDPAEYKKRTARQN